MRRRTVLAGLATGLASGLAGCSAEDAPASPGSPSAAPTDERTPTPTESETPTDRTPTDETPGGPVRWTAALDGAAGDPVYAGGSLRYADGGGPARDRWLFVPTQAGTLYAMSPATGEERWRADLGKPVRDAVVAPDAGLVVAHAGRSTLGDDHRVRAFDAGGSPQWTFPGSAGATPWGPLELLDADGERVFVASRDDQPMSSGETLWALNAADGTAVWSGEVGDPYDAAVTGEAVFVASRKAVDAFARPGGERLWRYSPEAGGTTYQSGTLRATGRTAFFGTESGTDAGSFRAVGPDGTQLWRRNRWATSATLADSLYLGGGPLTALDPSSGEERWSAQGPSFLVEGPIAAGRIFAGGDGIAAYDTASGDRHWTWTAPAEIVLPAAATDAAVYAGVGGGDDAPNVVYARNATDGSERWTVEGDAKFTDLVLGSQHLFVGAADGTVYALRR
ncbi:MAG: PQQ-binding-like beta-propeller repeat protein [Haloglomus sp.]